MKLWCAVVTVALGLVTAACSDSETAAKAIGDPPRVELIGSAVAALEAALGGPQRYFEVNATPTLVNLFVANEDATQATAYVYLGEELQEPDPSQPAQGPTFAASEMTFDAATVLSEVRAKLPQATLRAFSAVGSDSGGVAYVVTV